MTYVHKDRMDTISPTLAAALEYAALGWSVLPLCPADHVGVGKAHRGCNSPGKRPFFPPHGGGEWKEFQARRATGDEIRRWWDAHPKLNLGVALGPVSGLVGIDVDDGEGEQLLLELANGDLPQTWEYTTGKGRRLLYALPAGATVVNQAFKRPGTEIEILRFMSQGGQVVLPPSVHPNGSTYRWVSFQGPGDLPLAPVPNWLRGERANPKAKAARPADGELITAGGRNNYLTSLAGAMRRVGADEETIYAGLTATNSGRFDPPLEDAEVRSVARSVARYSPDEAARGAVPEFKTREDGDYERRFRWASELSAPSTAEDWIWRGYLPRAGTVLLSALWKAGKTTLLTHLLRALAADGEFLGQPVKAARVLYVSEEGERHWVRRRDAMSIGDHCGFYLQPFKGRPSLADWVGFVADLCADVEKHKFDLVVFDTLAKLWPVREENDAGVVDEALVHLWELTKRGAGVLLIHHLRKSGGQEYTASRGSGALSAFPDLLIELTRFDPKAKSCGKRVLSARGRYDETPTEDVVIELVDGVYRSLGAEFKPAADAAPQLSEQDRILLVLNESPDPWMQIDDIRSALRERHAGIRAEDVTTHLFSLYQSGRVVVRGILRSRTTPKEYALSSRVPVSGSTPECQRDGDDSGGTDSMLSED